MTTKRFRINLVEGHAIIEDNENIILIDTGSPSSIHINNNFNFMDSDIRVNQNYGGITIPALCDLVGTRITTLLGMDLLKNYRIIFDYPNYLITFSKDNNPEFEGEPVPLRIIQGIPVINAIINNHIIPCFFDSGARLSYLKSLETQDLHNQGDIDDFYPGIGRFMSATFEIETQVGSKTFPVLYGNLPRQVENNLLKLVGGNNGILGYDFLRKHKIYMHAAAFDLKIADSTDVDIKIPEEFSEEEAQKLIIDLMKKHF